MNKAQLRSFGSAWVLSLSALGAATLPAAGQVPDPLVEGKAIVRVLDGVAIGDFIAQFEADHAALNLGLAVGDTVAPRRMFLLTFDAGGLTEAQLDQLELDFQLGYLVTHLVWGDRHGPSAAGRQHRPRRLQLHHR
jgi:hypothetical protein